jgi:hypothetical protein
MEAKVGPHPTPTPWSSFPRANKKQQNKKNQIQISQKAASTTRRTSSQVRVHRRLHFGSEAIEPLVACKRIAIRTP